MHIYFVRHGETKLNQQGAYYGALDVPLTARGHAQAEQIGSYLSCVSFERVYISDKIRAKETAMHILEKTAPNHLPPYIREEPGLCELNFGCFEGFTNAQVQEKFPEIYRQWCGDWKGFQLPGGENFCTFFERVRSAFFRILEDADKLLAKNILICAHNGTLRVIFAAMCGLSFEGTWHFNFEQYGYSKADYEWGNFTIRNINVTAPEAIGQPGPLAEPADTD